jgi:hypothetical protein
MHCLAKGYGSLQGGRPVGSGGRDGNKGRRRQRYTTSTMGYSIIEPT